MNQYRNHHEREAARLRLLLANTTTPRVKARLSEEVEKLDQLAEGLDVPAVPLTASSDDLNLAPLDRNHRLAARVAFPAAEPALQIEDRHVGRAASNDASPSITATWEPIYIGVLATGGKASP